MSRLIRVRSHTTSRTSSRGEGKAPNASGGAASTDAEFHVPSVSDPNATDLLTSSTPHPESAHPDDPNSVAEKNKTTLPKD